MRPLSGGEVLGACVEEQKKSSRLIFVITRSLHV